MKPLLPQVSTVVIGILIQSTEGYSLFEISC